MSTIVTLDGTLSEISEALICLKGKPFSFDGYEFFRTVYDSPAQSKLLKCARQVAKSTYVGNSATVYAASIPHFVCLYVAPTENQVSVFNKQKLEPTMLHSPDFRKIWFTKNVTNQAMHKKLSNGSDVLLRSCFVSADSIRGISADMICLDEIQDILAENIPVIRECMTRSEYKYMLMAGTPKTNQHAIEFYWGKSKQFEWLVKCVSCNLWNLLGENNVKPKGLSCEKCDAFLDPANGEWVQTNLRDDVTIEGYRVSQLMVSWIPWSGSEGSIWDKFCTYSRAKFHNEVLALPFDDASCPITVDELIAACDPNLKMVSCREDKAALTGMQLSAGIDWGTGTEGNSYTVLTIGGFLPEGRFVVVFSKKYEGQEADAEHQYLDIVQTLHRFRVNVIGLDWGMGFGMNDRIVKEFTMEKVHVFYNSDNQRQPMQYDKKGDRWTLSRTTIMTDMFSYLKTKHIVLPNWDEIKRLASDALSIFATYVTRHGSPVMRYDHVASKTDDWFHSLTYCYLSAIVARQTS